ncbi:MAG: nucleotidyl transferase AbiEii/AbiGii toxin family protein [Anaerolineae bacterium]|nr:nucleotidyl transferase AbiEii/AbiGii toxin family protein [Anaerolineae bacterium]
MDEREFFQRAANGKVDFLQELLEVLITQDVSFCVIGGLAVNAYAEPVVSLDLDMVVVAEQLDALVGKLPERFSVRYFPHSVNIYSADSDLRVQIQTDARYQPFVARAEHRNVLGYDLPVASLEDVFQDKLWAYADPDRRPSKRQKDLADILRLVESHPHLAGLLPETIKILLD